MAVRGSQGWGSLPGSPVRTTGISAFTERWSLTINHVNLSPKADWQPMRNSSYPQSYPQARTESAGALFAELHPVLSKPYRNLDWKIELRRAGCSLVLPDQPLLVFECVELLTGNTVEYPIFSRLSDHWIRPTIIPSHYKKAVARGRFWLPGCTRATPAW